MLCLGILSAPLADFGAFLPIIVNHAQFGRLLFGTSWLEREIECYNSGYGLAGLMHFVELRFGGFFFFFKCCHGSYLIAFCLFKKSGHEREICFSVVCLNYSNRVHFLEI